MVPLPMKQNRQEVMHKSRNWTERYDWSAGKMRMPTGCGTTNTSESDTKKAHAQPVADEFDAHMHAWDQK